MVSAQPDPIGANSMPDDPPAGIPAETVLKLSASIKEKAAQLKQRESLLLEREKRLKFMLDDLQRERAEIDTMLQQADTRTQRARDLLEQVAQQSALAAPVTGDGTNDTGSGAESSQPLSETEKDNLRNVAEFLSGSQAEQAARTIKEFCNDGKMDLVAQMMRFLDARDVSKLLDALNDPVLVSELLDRYRKLPADFDE